MNSQPFYSQLQTRRTELGLTLQQVADVVGTSRGAISEIENGKVTSPTVNTIMGLSKALKWSPEQIFRVFQGKQPNKEPISPETLSIVKAVLHSLPKDALVACLSEMFPEDEMFKKMLIESKN